MVQRGLSAEITRQSNENILRTILTLNMQQGQANAGEIAEARRLEHGTGNATFRNDLIDAIFNLTEEQLKKGVRYEIYQG